MPAASLSTVVKAGNAHRPALTRSDDRGNFPRDDDQTRSNLPHLTRFGVGRPALFDLARSLPSEQQPRWLEAARVLSEPGTNAGRVVVSMHRSSCAIEKSPSTASRFPRRFVFIVGSGHSGSTVLAMILGAHPEILALSEIAFFDRWIGLNELCNCGVPVRSCPLWSKVVDRLSAKRAFSPTDFANEFAIDLSSIIDRTLSRQRLAHLVSIIAVRTFLKPIMASNGSLVGLVGATRANSQCR